MMVRVTQNLLAQQSLFNLQNNLVRMAQLQEQLSTGRRINRPSDDPIDFTRDLALRSDININRRFRTNINNATTDLELTETTLNSVTSLLQRARELTVQAGNNSSSEARRSIGNEISEIYQQLVDLGNTNIGGKYLFGGSNTTKKPFVIADGTVKYTGDDKARNVLIGTSTPIASNLTGNQTFLYQPNEIVSSVRIADPNATLIDAIAQANPSFSLVPPIPASQGSGETSASPNPKNYPTSNPNNLATFTIYGTEIHVDVTVDTLNDLVERINTSVADVNASITVDGRLKITAKRGDALAIQDGPKNPGYPAKPTFGNNVLSALGIFNRIQDQRDLDNGYPATDPLGGPPNPRSYVEVQPEAFIFTNTNTGPPRDPSTPFPDNLAINDLDGNAITKLQAIRIVIDGETIDIDLSGLTEGSNGANPATLPAADIDADNIPGSSVQDILDIINNHPQLQGRATVYIDDDGSGLGITATSSVKEFRVENVAKLFGHDITTRLQTVAGNRVFTRTDPITESTNLSDLPGALTDGNDSLGIRQNFTPPNPTNYGLITIVNGDRRRGIDLSDAITIGDVLRKINESDVGVEAKINPSGTGLTIERIDSSTGDLSVQDVSLGTMARDLGFFAALPPQTIVSDQAVVLNEANPLNTIAGVTAGDFKFDVLDHSGRVLDTYSISITNPATMTIGDFVSQLDRADGVEGPGGGLFSAAIHGTQLVISHNFNGHSIQFNGDATGLIQALNLDNDLMVEETEVNTALPAIYPYVSNQDTASILGLAGTGSLEEIEEKNAFKTIADLRSALYADDTEGISKALANIDDDLNVILNSRTVLGARLNRLDSSLTRLEDSEVFQRKQLSTIEDADLAALITDLTTQENAFNAALAATSRIIQPSLLDFLF